MTRGLDELDRGEWLLSMSSWVIQDGNYADFAVGEQRRFALEFFDKTLREVEPGIRSAEALGEARHEITAEVAYARDDLVMLDFGLLAYSDARAPAAKTGTWRSGSALLEVDHFAYFETHAKREGIPPAVYAWTITGIWRQTAPYILDPRLSEIRPASGMPRSIGPTHGTTTVGTLSICCGAGSRASRRPSVHDLATGPLGRRAAGARPGDVGLLL